MSVKKIFVSHSSKTADNLTLLKSMCLALENCCLDSDRLQYQVIYDQNGTLIGGDDWYNSIDQWMQISNAAIILFSKAALFDSDWIKKEASILSWRDNLDPDFLLIPVLLDSLKPEELEKGLFGVLKIRSRQCISYADDANQIASEVHKSLLAQSALLDSNQRDLNGASFEPLEGILAEIIASKASHDGLARTVTNLALQTPLWPSQEYKRHAIAIARYILQNSVDSMLKLLEFLNDIHPRLPKETAQQLFILIRGIWVNRQSAAGLTIALQTQETIGLNGVEIENYTVERYCERAWSLDASWKLVRIGQDSHTLKQVTDEIDKEISPSRASDKNRIQRRIKRARHPFIILVPARLISNGSTDDLLTKIKTRYLGAIILVDVGNIDIQPEKSPGWLPTNINLLKPPLNTEDEEIQIDLFQDMQDLFENQY